MTDSSKVNYKSKMNIEAYCLRRMTQMSRKNKNFFFKESASDRFANNKMFDSLVKKNFWTRNWLRIYFLLATFNIIAICVTLYSSHNYLKDYEYALDYTDKKIQVLTLIGEVSSLAQLVNAPGNDVFESKDVNVERSRFRAAKSNYDDKMALLLHLTREKPDMFSNPLNTHLESIDFAMTRMNLVASEIFLLFEKKQIVKAAALMAEMDRLYAELQKGIESLRRYHTELISLTLREHQVVLNFNKELTVYISVLIVLAIFGMVFFGIKLSNFAKNVLIDTQRIREILNSINQVAIVAYTDKYGNIVQFNDNYSKIYGFSPDEIFSKDNSLLKAGGIPKSIFRDIRKTISSDGVWTGDIQKVKKNGESYFVRSVVSPIKTLNGETEQYISISFDITEQKRLEYELLDAQKTAKIGSWKYDLLTGKQTWSTESYRIFEIDYPQSQEVLHQLYRDRIHPEDLCRLDRIIERATKFGEDFTYAHRISLDNGARIKHVRGIGKVTKDLDGQPVSISGTVQDLTDIVAMQEQNKFILDSMGIGIWKFNPVTQELFWDESLYKLYDLQPQEFSGHYEAWESYLSPANKQKAIEELNLALSGKKEFDTTFEIETKSGLKKHIAGKGIVVRNEKHEPIMMYGINWDKSIEVDLQNKLKDTLDLLEATGKMAKVGGWEFEIETGKVTISEQTMNLHEIDENIKCLNYKYAEQWYPPEAWPIVKNAVERALSEGVPYDIEVPFITAKARKIWVRTQGFPVYKNNKISGLRGTFQDITEKRSLMEKAEIERLKSTQNAKLASLGEMAAGIAHEINNPLAVIMCTVPLVSRSRSDEVKHNSKLEVITKSAERIEKIVKGLKKFSRTADGAEYKSEAISSLVTEALILTEARLKRHYTSMRVHVEPNLCIMCDVVEIEQVLVNLINNGIDAVKECDDKWIQINAFSDGDHAVMQIIDSGLGISTEIEKKLFQPFFTTKVVGEGTGLGLSIVKGILDNHKASFALNRAINNTCFEIRFKKVVGSEVKNVS